MTEAQFQEARKIMQKANHLRGLITAQKGKVAQWGAMEDANRRNLQEGKADGCQKIVLKEIEKLEKLRQRFAEMKFPSDDFKPNTKWICAIDPDSFNCMPKEIGEHEFEEAKKYGFTLHDTKQSCQNECDKENSL